MDAAPRPLLLPSSQCVPQRTTRVRSFCGRHSLCVIGMIAMAVFPSPGAAGDFICDVNSVSTSIDNGFGAELPTGREFSSVVQLFPPECLSEGVTNVNGVITDLTRTVTGSTAMAVVPQVRSSSMSGPPVDILVSGPQAVVQGVPVFPNFVRAPIPVPPTAIVLDLDHNGIVDVFVGSGLVLDSFGTQDQFVGYTRSGPAVPCFTTLVGDPLVEPCSNGDPLFRSLGQGLQMSAGKARVGEDSTYCPLDVRTNNPGVSIGAAFEMKLQLAAGSSCVPPAEIDVVDIVNSSGALTMRFEDHLPGTVMEFMVTPDELADWQNGQMWVVVTDGLFTDRDRIVPAQAIFYGDFESGSTSAWSLTDP
ncbi:MAG: hypothetical protein K8J08_10380 [Thermoanaerobaculia bacterium]|nr:hypothetical protein [Thermoanaerobaculia bacterium]